MQQALYMNSSAKLSKFLGRVVGLPSSEQVQQGQQWGGWAKEQGWGPQHSTLVKGSEQSCIAMLNPSSGPCPYPVPTPHSAHTLAQARSLTFMFPLQPPRVCSELFWPNLFSLVFSCSPFWDGRWAEELCCRPWLSAVCGTLIPWLIREMFRR